MRKLVLRLGALLGAVVLISACQDGDRTISAQPAGVADLTGGGFSQEGLDAIQEMMETAITDGRISAGIAMVARDGKIPWLGTAGEMEPGIPMRDDAILPLASVGKMFTATAAMILYERGVISLDDPVSKYIPEFAHVRVGVTDEDGATSLVAPETPITVYHLLTHTGGLTVTGDEFWAAWDTHTGNTTTTHFARALAAMPLHSQPGAQFQYGQTGASYEVLAAVQYSEDDIGSGAPGQYGWVGGGFAKLWVDPEQRLIAYFNFPLNPPGDNELLAEFEERVNAAMTDSY